MRNLNTKKYIFEVRITLPEWCDAPGEWIDQYDNDVDASDATIRARWDMPVCSVEIYRVEEYTRGVDTWRGTPLLVGYSNRQRSWWRA